MKDSWGFLTREARNIRDIVYPVVMKLEAFAAAKLTVEEWRRFFFFFLLQKGKTGNSLDRRQIWNRNQVSLCWNPPNKNVKSQMLEVSEFNFE